MARPLPTALLDRRFLPVDDVRVSPLDRGFLFGDGVYEVIPVYSGRYFHLPAHLKRLQYSLDCLGIRNPHSDAEWTAQLEELVKRNGGGDQAVYLQVTRGNAGERDHAFPRDVAPTVFAMSSPLGGLSEELRTGGARVITLQDIRWHRCDIKTTALLGNVLLRQQAASRGCHEAILLRDGFATEGTASSFFIVRDGTILTPPKSADLLPSITRDVVLMLAQKHALQVCDARIPAAELKMAEEIWLASSTREVYSVTELDGEPVGDGKPGAQWRRMYDLFQRHKQELACT